MHPRASSDCQTFQVSALESKNNGAVTEVTTLLGMKAMNNTGASTDVCTQDISRFKSQPGDQMP
jgi:hypothetical protein